MHHGSLLGYEQRERHFQLLDDFKNLCSEIVISSEGTPEILAF